MLAVGAPANAGKPGRDAGLEQRIRGELERISMPAAVAFTEGTSATDKGDFTLAEAKLREAHELAPASSHPLRRLCFAELNLRKRDEAREHCREAARLEDSAMNHAALARALVATIPGMSEHSADRSEARTEINRALKLEPDDASTLMTAAEVALANQDTGDFRDYASRLERVAPDEPQTHLYAAIRALFDERWSDADDELDKARSLGAPDAAVDDLRERMHAAMPPLPRYAKHVKRVALAWLLALAFLTATGVFLSRLTLRVASRLPKDPGVTAHGAGRALRTAYRVVLWLACAFYYLSIPLVLSLTLLLTGAIVFGLLASGYIPIKLLLLLVMLAAATVWAVVKSAFTRVREVAPGERVDLDEHPRLRALLDEVASAVGTRPVDVVYLTPGTEVGVSEAGSVLARLRGQQSERRLILGAGVLHGMRLDELRAVLAHEYGHFVNEDTAGGGFALAVRRSLVTTAINLGKEGVASLINPYWLFLRGFFSLFLRISQGASRLQEILADRWAAFAYGSDAFERGLRHVVTRSAQFRKQMDARLEEVVRERIELHNVYRFTPRTAPSAEDLEQAAREALEAKATPFDSHPTPAERIALIRALAAEPRVRDEEDGDAWDIFSSRKAVEEGMTDVIRSRLEAKFGALNEVKQKRRKRKPPVASTEETNPTDAG